MCADAAGAGVSGSGASTQGDAGRCRGYRQPQPCVAFARTRPSERVCGGLTGTCAAFAASGRCDTVHSTALKELKRPFIDHAHQPAKPLDLRTGDYTKNRITNVRMMGLTSLIALCRDSKVVVRLCNAAMTLP